MLNLDNVVVNGSGGWGYIFSGCAFLTYGNLYAINTSRTDNVNSMAFYFDSNKQVLGNTLHVLDYQDTPTGYRVVTWPHDTITQRGVLGNIHSRIINGKLAVEHNSRELVRGQILQG